MRKIIGASLLIVALSGVTYAGNMPTPGADPEPTSRPSDPPQLTASGFTPDGEAGDVPNDGLDGSTMAEALLSLMQSVLSLF